MSNPEPPHVTADATGEGHATVEVRIAGEGRVIENNAEAPVTEKTKITRGHSRTRTLQVRLNDDELDALDRIAESRNLPVSTIAREHLLGLIGTVDDDDPILQIRNAAALISTLTGTLKVVATARGTGIASEAPTRTGRK